MAKLETIIMRGLHADRPAAGTGGRLYYETDTSTLYRDSGSAWESIEGVGDFSNPMTTAGDLIKGGSSGTPQRLAAGSTGQVLTISGGAPTWQTPAAGFTNPMTTVGDIIFEDIGPAPARLPVGSTGQILTVSGGKPSWQNATTVSGFTNPMTTADDLIYGSTGGAPARLPKGTEGQVLSINGGHLSWQTPSGLAGGGGSNVYVARQTVTPATDGTTKTFSLPEAAFPGSISVLIKPSGQAWYSIMGPDDFTEDGYGTDVIGSSQNPTISPGASSFGVQTPLSKLNDNNDSTYIGWDVYSNVVVTYDFGGSTYAIQKGTVTSNTTDGWSGPKDVKWEYSDDGSSWTTAKTGTCISDGDGVKTIFTWSDQGAHRYWRLNVLTSWVNSAGYFISIQEIEMMEATASAASITLTNAPASTDKLMVSYQKA